MFRLIFTATANTHGLLGYAPSNLLLDYIRTRRDPKWALWAMLIAVPYFAIAYWCTTLIDNGAPGWLHLIVLLCIINAFKFLINGPITAARLISVRRRERKHDHPRRQVPSAPVGHEALPDDEHGAAYLSRTSGALHT